jgi:LmbE family N-acetylglucosaminyl deacetylase
MAMIRAGDALRRMEALPFADLDAIAPGTSLILAPHPDDETLGCGGLIASLCAHGRPPVIVVVTDGTGSHPGSASYPPARLKSVREAELRKAAAILGVGPERVHLLGLRDTQAPQEGAGFAAAVQEIASIIRAYEAATIFASWEHDTHGDHKTAARMARAAAQSTGARLLFYPVWGWLLPPEQQLPLGRVNGARLHIGSLLPRKQRAIAAHASQTSDLITDDPNGFRLPSHMLALFERPFEVFLDPG